MSVVLDGHSLSLNLIEAVALKKEKVVISPDAFDKIEDVHEFLKHKDFNFEGFVIIDKFLNRVKVKNPTYLSAHHTKSKTSFYHILTIKYCKAKP